MTWLFISLPRGAWRGLTRLTWWLAVGLPRGVVHGLRARAVIASLGWLASAPRRLRLLPSPLPTLLTIGLVMPLLLSPGGAHQVTGEVAVADDLAPLEHPAPARVAPLPAPAPRAPGRPPGRAPVARRVVADQVRVVAPDLIVRPRRVQPAGLRQVSKVRGVAHVAGAREVLVAIRTRTGPAPLRLLVVDPAAFRPLTPDPTAKTPAVWERLLDGEMVVRHDVAQSLQLPLGATVQITGPSKARRGVRIGAFASNGTPPLADAIVPWQVGTSLGVFRPNVLVIAVSDEAKPEQVGKRLVQAVGGGKLTKVQPPPRHRARLLGRGSARFEPFTYIDHGDGMITIDPGWVRRNIVSVDLPIFGVARCHRVMVPQLVAALQEVVDTGLAGLIDPSQYGGCWVPRHVLFDPGRQLSMHAWGLAIDFNVRSNQYGAVPTLDVRIVDILRKWGFKWGGDWGTPDGMHFELRTVIHMH